MSMDTPVSVLLVDDDALIRAGLRAILSSDPGIFIAGEAENGCAPSNWPRAWTPR
ncbi:hypothetical protein ACIOTN_06495 [Glutamicibacter sp. NPDC087661]|uniref:hypothetical protein n=1 Tax=Micrococcaceae TaxID=1268 RepID=UPI0025708D8D|nr:hypothetical protein [Arthrobacter sp. MYb214]